MNGIPCLIKLLDRVGGQTDKRIYRKITNKTYEHCRYRSFFMSVHCHSYAPLGLASDKIPDSSLTASSHYKKYPPFKARLHCGADCAWYAEPWDHSQPWLQVDLGNVSLVSGIATQGKRFTNYVKTYKIKFSVDRTSWNEYKEDGQVRVS